MKLVFLVYLEGDHRAVEKLLDEAGISGYSQLPLEGHGPGAHGWYGDIPAYESRMIFALVPEVLAERLMETVSKCTGCQDPKHPIHAALVDVEKVVTSGLPLAPPAT